MKDQPRIYVIADDALGILLEPGDDRHRLAKHISRSKDWRDVIPEANGICVQFDPMIQAPDDARARLEEALSEPIERGEDDTKHWVIPVCYAPEYAMDMDRICAETGLSRDAIIARHTAAIFTIDMLGFTPGFAYLSSADFTPNLNRLTHPRQQVPAGSVGLARNQCGLYALDGPGGWPIIGRTPFALFAASAPDPFVLTPGDSMKFEPISERDFQAYKP